jgi:anti-sigma regulatory factor (Ser/Thr protein kinase)
VSGRTPTRRQEGFCHKALFYADADEFLAGTVPFVRWGLEADDVILVAMPAPSLRLLKGALGDEAERVRFVDMEDLGRNPARIISAWRDFLSVNPVGCHGVRGIGEPIWAGRSAAELDECHRHEALLNLAFDGDRAWSLMCPYNTTALSDGVLSEAEHNHPVLSGGRERSTEYSYDSVAVGVFEGGLERPAGKPQVLIFTLQRLAEVRRLVADHATRAGLDAQRASDLVVAASEVAANSLRHGGGEGRLEIWHPEDDALVCDFRDSGRIENPLVGRERPPADQASGRGLWLVNQLCDLVQIRSDRGGTLIRLQMTPR